MIRKTSTWEGQALAELKRRWDRPHVHLYSRVDSTNARALELAEEGAAAGTIVLADEQTAGRGVDAHRWYSPKGTGLYLSLVLRPMELPNPLLVPLLAGLGVARAVERLLETVQVGMKWPNDLIVSGRKAGGVLSEAAWSGQKVKHIALGVGINVRGGDESFPSALRRGAISLEAVANADVSRLELADRVLEEVEARCAEPPETLDGDFLRELDRYDWLRDRRCRVRRNDGQEVKGTAVGIAPDGAMLFRPDRGALERVTAGRVLPEDLVLPEW